MMQKLFPNDKLLANEANHLYPSDIEFIFWVIENNENNLSTKKSLLSKAIILDPINAITWRELGSLYLEEKNFLKAIDAFKNSCLLNDEISNGCFLTGRVYQSLGEYEKSIYYFRKSSSARVWEIADRLEAELSQQKP